MSKEKYTYCFQCHCWKPQTGSREHDLKGRCRDLKATTMRLDFCETDKIPKEGIPTSKSRQKEASP
jgi:hypothetical protein